MNGVQCLSCRKRSIHTYCMQFRNEDHWICDFCWFNQYHIDEAAAELPPFRGHMMEVKVPDGVGAVRGLAADIEIYQQFLAFLNRTFKLIARLDYDQALIRSKCNLSIEFK
jgi:hypothetical protein